MKKKKALAPKTKNAGPRCSQETKKSAEDVSRDVCGRIHALRQEMGWSLDVLSSRSGVSRSMLSQIERQKANPTLAVTVKIANALGVSVAKLIQETAAEPNIEVIRADSPFHMFRRDEKCSLRTLSPMHHEKDVEFYELVMKPEGKLRSAPHVEGTREFLTVQKGKLSIASGQETINLCKGDSASYRADLQHQIQNSGRGDAICYLVVVYS